MTHDLPDYYTALGVTSTASPAEITHAYRSRVRSQHPDSHPDTQPDKGEEGLREVIAAYTVLRDPAQRADYDQHRQSSPNASPPPTITPPITPFAPPGRTPPLRVGPVRYHGPPHQGHQ